MILAFTNEYFTSCPHQGCLLAVQHYLNPILGLEVFYPPRYLEARLAVCVRTGCFLFTPPSAPQP